MSKHFTKLLLLLIGLGLCASSAIALAESKTDAAESRSVKMIWTKVGKEGTAVAEGCTQCPIQFSVNHKTKFKYHGKKLSSDKTSLYSGQPGTVIYTVSDKHALKVVW